MKALISPNENPVYYISGWKLNPNKSLEEGRYSSIFTAYPNSCRVAQVEPDDKIFAVADPLFWVDCPDNCVKDEWWYDTQANTIQPIINTPLSK